jgi:hypothetical protein
VHHIKALQRPNFVSAVCHAVPAGLGAASGIILAACLDCSLKVYAAEKLRLRSSMTWNCGVVTTLLYNRCVAVGRTVARQHIVPQSATAAGAAAAAAIHVTEAVILRDSQVYTMQHRQQQQQPTVG